MSLLNKRDGFSSNLGFILASAGSAIGLGNIWRFPYLVGKNGGAAFVMLYAVLLITIGVSVLLVELAIGRNGQGNCVKSYSKINKNFKWLGFLNIVTSFFILAFYSVVGGWTIYFFIQSIVGNVANKHTTEMEVFFSSFISAPLNPIICLAVFLGLTMFIVAKGISKGIEVYNKFLMPALFIMIIILLVRSVTLPGALEGVKWYLHPDFSLINGTIFVTALGQALFSLSVGHAVQLTYASYLSKNANLPRSSIYIAMFDLIVSILIGFVIFPAVFAFGIVPGAGPELAFVTIPQVFSEIVFGEIFIMIFFLLLLSAALGSSIAHMEVVLSYFVETFKAKRSRICFVYGMLVFLFAIPASLSFGPWGSIELFHMNIFSIYEYATSNISLPFSALICSILVGWFWKKEQAIASVTNNGTVGNLAVSIWLPLVKYVVPLAVLLIWLQSIGII